MSTISSWQAFFLGLVEGITEFLPISSTGHLVITSELLGLRRIDHLSQPQIAAVQGFEIVVQGGAILAVLWLYQSYFREMFLGLLGQSPKGRTLLLNVCLGTFPVLLAGYVLKGFISRYLQFTGPVLLALAMGGLIMVLFERYWFRVPANDAPSMSIDEITWRQAAAVGLLQCLALWPGTSRSMVTIIGGMAIGLRRNKAAEFSFLLGLPVLLAATGYKAIKDGDVMLQHIGPSSLIIGLMTSTVSAIIAIKWLVAFLSRRGLAVFGWYRLALAGVVFLIVGL